MQKYHHSTLLRTFSLLMATLWLCSSCIDEFNAELPDSDQTFLVVEGSICGNSTNTFHLSRSLSLSPSPEDVINRHITDAQVMVCGSDDTKVPAKMTTPGNYELKVGKLNASTEYWLKIEWKGKTFMSEPALPLAAPKIIDLHFEQPHEDQVVQMLITPEAPQKGEVQYFRWNYTEDWEIRTPYHHEWDYFPENDSIAQTELPLSRGWSKELYHPSIIGNNTDYVNGEIRNMNIFSVDHLDMRFNYLYRVTITQRAISREEYEYERLSQRQSDDMGGLFTPQPSELPTNVHCTDGSTKAIGYVGVSLNTTKAELYIRNNEVGYRVARVPRMPTQEELGMYTRPQLYTQQFRILYYDEMAGDITWIERWALDCTTWGADPLARPEGWPND